MSSSYRKSLNDWLSQLEVSADRVLDIGGSQEKVKDRVKSWEVKEYLIADLPNPHKDSPKPDIELDLNDGMTPKLNYETDGMDFDLIFCLEVFDYVWNPIYALGLIHIFLSKGGTAWVTFPSVYPLHQPVEDDALRYMPGGIKKLADSVGLEIVQMIPKRFETNAWDNLIRAERMRAAKHEDHNFSGWIVELKK